MSGRTGRLPVPPARITRVLLAIIALGLLGATAFGLWHVVVGGLVNGNARAAAFGAVLALVAGVTLAAGVWLSHRRRSGAS